MPTTFEQLPLNKSGPRGNAWGLWGDSDELGRLNLLDAETTVAAAKEIQHGIRISLDLPLNHINPPCFGRMLMKHTVKNLEPVFANDDELSFNTQSSSQWDGFRHCGYQKEQVFYNGCTQEEVMNSERNGTNAWVKNGGIVGRGVLLDYKAWAESKGLWSPDSCFESTTIPASTIKDIATRQGVTFQKGDILFLRTGWTAAYNKMSSQQRQKLAENENPHAIGVESSEEILRWIWDNNFAAVAGDHPSFEAWPPQNEQFMLHEWLLAGWGMPIGEIFDLDKLAQTCQDKQKWSFFFSSMPLNVPGGVASPPNGVAIL